MATRVSVIRLIGRSIRIDRINVGTPARRAGVLRVEDESEVCRAFTFDTIL